MKDTTQQRIDDALKKWEVRITQALSKEAFKSYLAADVEAFRAIGLEAGFEVVNEAAQKFAQDYRRLLATEGATLINGQKIPWLKALIEKARSEVAAIIQDAIASGTPTGIRQLPTGGYEKGSVAAKLAKYFSTKTSHASTVARTEVGRIQNVAKLGRWQERGYQHVRVKDGDGANPCARCQEVNGQIWTLEYALSHELEHPNCVRSFIPVKLEEGMTVVHQTDPLHLVQFNAIVWFEAYAVGVTA